MKQKKDEIREAIFFHAKAEFIEKGFQKTSMRSIAARSSVTLSNIYTYFKNKDVLFSSVLQPLINKIESGKQALELHSKDGVDDTVDEHFDIFNIVLDFLEENRTDLQLLLYKSRGSQLETYLSEFKKWYAHINKLGMMRELGEARFSDLNISDFVMDFVSSIYVDVIVKAMESDLERDELIEISHNITAYGHSGWKGLIAWKSGE